MQVLLSLAVFVTVFVLFYALPWIAFRASILKSTALVLPVEPWIMWSKRSDEFFDHLAFSLRTPFFMVVTSIATLCALDIRGDLAANVVFSSLGFGVIAGLSNYLTRTKDEV